MPRAPQKGVYYPQKWSLVQDQLFYLKVQQGLIPGHSFVSKFGENTEVTTVSTPEDIWDGGGLYTYDADGTAPIVSLISDSASDTEPILIEGLDINGEFIRQIITLNGTTRVALTTPLWRVFRMVNFGTSGLVGTVYCYIGTGGVPVLSDTRAVIEIGNDQTLMGVYTIPAGKVGFLIEGEAGVSLEGTGVSSGTNYTRVAYKSRLYGKIFTIKKALSLMTTANSNYHDGRPAPDPVPALTDLRVQVTEVTADSGVWTAFVILLIDEGLFEDSYLARIFQPGYF